MSFFDDYTGYMVVESSLDSEIREAFSFMRSLGLSPDRSFDFLLGIKKDGQVVATGAALGSVIKFLAVNPEMQGEGLAAKIVTELLERLSTAGIHHQFVYTKPDVAAMLLELGFPEVASVEDKVTLLEGGIGSIKNWCRSLATFEDSNLKAAAVVVNGNPLTLGHLHLLRQAHDAEGALHILVVSTEQSLFPAKARLSIIKEAVRDWPNTLVHEAGQYIVSMATFPSYFTRKEEVAMLQASLDIEVFGRHVAKALNISARYVGEEPYCPVTSLYNKAMSERLENYGIRFVQIPRIEALGSAISASRVRQLLREGESPSSLKGLIPEATLNFLQTAAGRDVIEKIKSSSSRH